MINKIIVRLICLVVVASTSGCAFLGTKRHLELVQTKLATLEGVVTMEATNTSQIVVAVWNARDVRAGLLTYTIMAAPGKFRLVVAAPGRYGILAFADLNDDLKLNDHEPVVIVNGDGEREIMPGEMIRDIRLTIGTSRMETSGKAPIAIDLSSLNPTPLEGMLGMRHSVGEVVSLSDPRFSPEHAKIGLWEPIRFLQEVGIGLYFLQPFDPRKTPVLFIHGADADPGVWRYLIEHLDHTKFQPWVYYYPTGLRLTVASEALSGMVSELRARHQIKTLCVVAHSMGGLVEKGFLNELKNHRSPVKIPLAVSISTPWGGHEAAAMGIKNAPAVVPAWHDMVPGSPFIKSLWETPFPDGTKFHLLFGYDGKYSVVMGRNNDGAVTLESELFDRAQDAACRLRGFSETHTGILSSEAVSGHLNTLLEDADRNP
jgi:pimeloyl-ACP methyl ester carboxylesterase